MTGPISLSVVREKMQRALQRTCGVFRTEALLKEGIAELQEACQDFFRIGLKDHSKIWNTELVDLLELRNLLPQALVTLESALHRTESRGAHFRHDYPHRDDTRWLVHTLVSYEGGHVLFGEKPVHLRTKEAPPLLPEKRVY
jgi:succinate dehydrogenase / fumarate reductase flavoprotein subunit